MYLVHVHLRHRRGAAGAGPWWPAVRDRMSTMVDVRHVAVHTGADGAVVFGAYVVAESRASAESHVYGAALFCLRVAVAPGDVTLVRCAAVPIVPPVD